MIGCAAGRAEGGAVFGDGWKSGGAERTKRQRACPALRVMSSRRLCVSLVFSGSGCGKLLISFSVGSNMGKKVATAGNKFRTSLSMPVSFGPPLSLHRGPGWQQGRQMRCSAAFLLPGAGLSRGARERATLYLEAIEACTCWGMRGRRRGGRKHD